MSTTPPSRFATPLEPALAADPTPPGSLPKPGVRRDPQWLLNSGSSTPQPQPLHGTSPHGTAPVFRPTPTAAPAVAGGGQQHVTNTEASFALDLQSFGLQNSQLQHALSSMLKAIVSLSEDHKVVRSQLESFQNASREAQTTLAMDLDGLNERIAQDFLGKKEWTEARYDDHRRTDRVAQHLHEFQQEQLTGMTAVLPRIAAVEQQLMAVQDRVARGEERFAVAADVTASLDRAAAAEEERAALTAKHFSAHQHEITHLRDDTNRELTDLKRDVGSLTDVSEEHRAAIAKTAATVKRDSEAIDDMQAELAAASRRIADTAARAEERLQSTREQLDASLSDLKRDVGEQLKSDHERAAKAENHFLFQVASFETVSQDHGMKLKALTSDVEAVKGELAALNFTAESAGERATDAVARSQNETQQALKKIRDDVAALKTSSGALERSQAAASEDLGDAIEHAVADLKARLKALEGRKKADDAQFRDFLTAKVADEIEAAVRESERRRTATAQKESQHVRKAMGTTSDTIAALQTRVSELELMCESAIDTVNTLGSSASDTLGRSNAAEHDVRLLATLLNADLDVLRRIGGDSDEAADAMLRYRRSLNWAVRPQSPQRPTRPAAQSPPDHVVRRQQQQQQYQQYHSASSNPSRPSSPMGAGMPQQQQQRRASPPQQQQQQQTHALPALSIPVPVAVAAATGGVDGSCMSSRRGSPTHGASAPPPLPQAVTDPASSSTTSWQRSSSAADVQQQQFQLQLQPPQPQQSNTVGATAVGGSPARRMPGTVTPDALEDVAPPHPGHDGGGGQERPRQHPGGLAPHAVAPAAGRQEADPQRGGNVDSAHFDVQPVHQDQRYHSAALGNSSSLSTRPPPQQSQRRDVSPARPVSPPHPSAAAAAGNPSPYGKSRAAPATAASSSRKPLGVEINNAPGGGVVVLKVEPDGAADVAGLSKGDVIVGFGDAPIATKDEFRDAYIAACGRGAVALSVVPGGRSTASRLQLTLVL